jgi:hypothetical protein
VVVPLIDPGSALTVTVIVAAHPVVAVKVIVAVPDATPDMVPVAEPTVTIVTSLLLQVPPSGSVRDAVAPSHTWVVPEIAVGNEFTVTTVVVIQPVLSV